MSIQRNYNEDLNEVIATFAKRMKAGDIQAFNWLHEHFSKPIYRFCFKMIGDEAVAKDAYQETFVKVFEHRASFQEINFTAWIYTIARRVCLNLLRSKKSFDQFDEELHSNDEPLPQDALLRQQIQLAIESLPQQLKEALILREFDELSYQEIALTLGIDLSLAKIRVHRARIIIRKILAPIVQDRYEH